MHKNNGEDDDAIPQFGYCDAINIDALARWALIQYWACKMLFTKTT